MGVRGRPFGGGHRGDFTPPPRPGEVATPVWRGLEAPPPMVGQVGRSGYAKACQELRQLQDLSCFRHIKHFLRLSGGGAI